MTWNITDVFRETAARLRFAWLAAPLLVAMLTSSRVAQAGEGSKAAPKPPEPAVAALAGGATVQAAVTVDELYPTAGLRDPFLEVAGVGGGPKVAVAKDGEAATVAAVMNPEDFSIHNLELKAVMEDRMGGFAILTDPKFAKSYVLKRGRLVDDRNKAVKGVTGIVKAKQKTVQLIGPERDVQVLTMSEREEKETQGNAKDKQ